LRCVRYQVTFEPALFTYPIRHRHPCGPLSRSSETPLGPPLPDRIVAPPVHFVKQKNRTFLGRTCLAADAT
jgi:hypothetical protein